MRWFRQDSAKRALYQLERYRTDVEALYNDDGEMDALRPWGNIPASMPEQEMEDTNLKLAVKRMKRSWDRL